MSKYSFLLLLLLHSAPFFLLLLLLSPDATVTARELGTTTTTRSLGSGAEDYVAMKPLTDHKKQIFRRKEVKNCMPKGNRHSSAPSRYINYHAMGSSGCSSTSSNNNRKLP